jgi:hypothetical protein
MAVKISEITGAEASYKLREQKLFAEAFTNHSRFHCEGSTIKSAERFADKAELL